MDVSVAWHWIVVPNRPKIPLPKIPPLEPVSVLDLLLLLLPFAIYYIIQKKSLLNLTPLNTISYIKWILSQKNNNTL